MKFIYSERAIVEISQNLAAFSEYINFNIIKCLCFFIDHSLRASAEMCEFFVGFLAKLF